MGERLNGIQEVRGSIPLSSTSFVGLWRSLVARFLGVEEVVGSNPASPTKFGVWLSLVERTVRDREVAGSNPVTPTKSRAGMQSMPALDLLGPQGFEKQRPRGPTTQDPAALRDNRLVSLHPAP